LQFQHVRNHHYENVPAMEILIRMINSNVPPKILRKLLFFYCALIYSISLPAQPYKTENRRNKKKGTYSLNRLVSVTMLVDIVRYRSIVIKIVNERLSLMLHYDIFFGFLLYASFQSFHQTCCCRKLFKTFHSWEPKIKIKETLPRSISLTLAPLLLACEINFLFLFSFFRS
jgi:hypothetical protein